MDLGKKINYIGRMLANIQLEVYNIKRNQEELRTFLTNPDKLDFERYWKKINKGLSSLKIK